MVKFTKLLKPLISPVTPVCRYSVVKFTNIEATYISCYSCVVQAQRLSLLRH